tara:strand:+ start:62 stop:919 length:858 start_codon:yes stop_codon:yes gene_type:complete
MKNQFKLLAFAAGSALSLGVVPSAFADTTGSTTASVPALSAGMIAPTLNVGTDTVSKGTVQYSNSVGSNDAFSVGANTNIGASVNASSTPDYSVTSNATFGVSASTINQVIGTSAATNSSSTNTISDIDEVSNTLTETEVEKDFTKNTTTDRGGWWWWNRRNNTRTHISDDQYESTKEEYSKQIKSDITETLTSTNGMDGTISGSFAKTFTDTGNSNDVTVKGIGTDANVVAGGDSAFTSGITKNTEVENAGAGTASGGAAGSVGTTATANANSSQFVSSFAQAY